MNFSCCRSTGPRPTILIVAICSLAAATAMACKVPVFRYALERWPVDNYRMVAIVEGKEDEVVRKALDQLEAIANSGANVETEVIDLATLSEEQLWQLEDFDGSADTPLLQIFYPEKDGERIKCWEGEFSQESVSSWQDSPIREQIVADLVGGDSAVFLLIDGTDADRNDQIAGELQTSLAAASKEIKVPDGVITRSDANKFLQEHPEASMDDVLRSDVPLRVEFRLRRLRRDDPNESALLSIVHGLVEDRDEPILVPIFGRGRMLDAMKAQECDSEVILNACRYLVGECSCTVKALNPGVDLVLTVNWSDQLGQSVVMVNPSSGGDSGSEAEPTFVAIPSGDPTQDAQVTVIESPRRWGMILPIVVGALLFLVLFGIGKAAK